MRDIKKTDLRFVVKRVSTIRQDAATPAGDEKLKDQQLNMIRAIIKAKLNDLKKKRN